MRHAVFSTIKPGSVKKILRAWTEGESFFVSMLIENKCVKYKEAITLRFDNGQVAETLEALAWANVLNYAE